MPEQRTSAMSFASFSPHNPDGSLPEVADRREHIVGVAMAWQGHSARGGMAGFRYIDRLHAVGAGDVVESVNRVVELHGLMGSIGEQLSLAYAAEQDAQRWLARPIVGDPSDLDGCPGSGLLEMIGRSVLATFAVYTRKDSSSIHARGSGGTWPARFAASPSAASAYRASRASHVRQTRRA
ncbi:hypothetical protein ABZW10_31415 [Kitasatospora sp. NPDC004723]|uniref:hypothetical protein n=1 Tax=Kitasatospora sp. NPDC004723 TaxID=3154288 RepID=UPI0033B3349A